MSRLGLTVPTPAFRLAVACCRWCIAADNRDELVTLLGMVTGTDVLAMARRHRIVGLVHRAVREAGSPLAEGDAALLAEAARHNTEQGLVAAAESRALHGHFDAAGIPLLFLKGLTVGQLAWGDSFLKTSWDLDLLVLPEDIERAASLLSGLGYEQQTPLPTRAVSDWHHLHKESVWRAANGLHLDLHSRLVDQPRLLPTLDASSPQQDVEILPRLILPTLASEELFAYLCVHGASSAWFRLKWIADLAALIDGDPPLRIEQLFRRSQQLGAGRAASQALLLVAQLFGPLASPQLERELRADKPACRLAHIALRELCHDREPTERALGTAMIHASQLALGGSLGFAMAEMGRQLRSAVSR